MTTKKFSGLSRRDTLKGMAAGGAMVLGGISAPALAQSRQKFVLAIGSQLGMEWVPEMNAVAGGHFEKQGLDVELANVPGTAVAIQQVLGGRAKFATAGSIDLIKAFAKKQPVLSVGTISQGGIYTIASLKSAPILKPEDLRGKIFGVVSLGGSTENMLDLLLASAGIDPKEVERQAIGRSLGSIELVKQQRIHAFLSIPEIDVAIEMANEPLLTWNTDKYAPLPGQCYVATKESIAQDPALVEKFIKGMRGGVDDILASDPNKILDRVEKAFDIAGDKDRKARMASMKAYMDLVLTHGRENILVNVPSAWKKGVDLMAAAKLADVRADIDSIYTNKYVGKASP